MFLTCIVRTINIHHAAFGYVGNNIKLSGYLKATAFPHKSVISRNTSSEITQLQDENQSLHFKHKNASSHRANYGCVRRGKRVYAACIALGLAGYMYMIVHNHGPSKLQNSKQKRCLLQVGMGTCSLPQFRADLQRVAVSSS